MGGKKVVPDSRGACEPCEQARSCEKALTTLRRLFRPPINTLPNSAINSHRVRISQNDVHAFVLIAHEHLPGVIERGGNGQLGT